MTIMSSIAVEREMQLILLLLDDWKEKGMSSDEQLEQLRSHIDQTIEKTKDSWR